jgi:hypothetical protein
MENRWMWRATNRVTLPLQDTVDTSNTNFKVFCKLGVKSGKRTQALQLRRNFCVSWGSRLANGDKLCSYDEFL